MNQLCPGCHTKEETFCHVIQCTHPTTASHRDSALNTLTKTLQHIGTPKPILQDILSEFKLWLQSTTTASSLLVGSLKGPDILLSATFYEQYHEIGWYKLYLGRISSKWASMATPYDTSLDGDLWASHFISTLWIFLCSIPFSLSMLIITSLFYPLLASVSRCRSNQLTPSYTSATRIGLPFFFLPK